MALDHFLGHEAGIHLAVEHRLGHGHDGRHLALFRPVGKIGVVPSRRL